jgi:transcriptional regulator GlxA family with amidase domain
LAIAGGKPRQVAMRIYPGLTLMDVAGPLEVFSFANILRKATIYDVVTVAPTAGPVRTTAGVGLMPTCAMGLALPVDTLIVLGGGRPRNWITREIIDWLRVAEPQTRRFGVTPARYRAPTRCGWLYAGAVGVDRPRPRRGWRHIARHPSRLGGTAQ